VYSLQFFCASKGIGKKFLQGNEYLKIFSKKKFLFTRFSQKKFDFHFDQIFFKKMKHSVFFVNSYTKTVSNQECYFFFCEINSWIFFGKIFRMDQGFL